MPVLEVRPEELGPPVVTRFPNAPPVLPGIGADIDDDVDALPCE
jgi:hypothetical protein